jgi:hypothetical protein
LPALRQVVLLTGRLEEALAETRAFLGLRAGVRDEAGMAALGFAHEVLAIDETFVEVVAPLAADSSPGRLLARRGESGYMVVAQVADVAALRSRAAEIGLHPIMDSVFEGNLLTQWHPRDLGTLAEIDEMRSGQAWHFCPALSDTGCTDVVADIRGVEVAVADPAEYTRRWAHLLDLPAEAGATELALGGRYLRFVTDTGDGPGLRTVEVTASGERGAGSERVLCGVLFRVCEPVGVSRG